MSTPSKMGGAGTRGRNHHLPYLSPELWNEVLARLPVKSLIRFRCVCKTWRSLINHPSFVSLHLSCHRNDDFGDTRLLFTDVVDRSRRWLIRGCEELNEIDVIDGRNTVLGLRLHRVKGCVNGVVLVVNRHTNTNSIILMNLSIRKLVKVPMPSFCESHMFKAVQQIGLLFDDTNDEYKVVVLSKSTGLQPGFVAVYSLKNQNWKKSECGFLNVQYEDYPLFLNGSLHWIVRDSQTGKYIVSFHAVEEVLSMMSLPNLVNVWYSRLLTSIDGRLTYLVSFEKHLEIWVMEEYGVAGSWNKRHVINNVLWTSVSVYVNRNGKLMFASARGVVKIYDFRTEFLTDTELIYSDFEGYVDTYVESLALYHEGSPLMLKKMDKKKEEGKDSKTTDTDKQDSEELRAEEGEKAKLPGTEGLIVEELLCRAENLENFIRLQLDEEKEKLMEIHKKKMNEMKKRYEEEEAELKKQYYVALIQLMEKYISGQEEGSA